MTTPVGLTYGTISFSVGQLLSSGQPLTGVTGAITIRPTVHGSILATSSTPPVTLATGPFTFNIVDGVMVDGQGSASISLIASDCPVLNPTNWTYKALYGVNGVNHGTIYFSLPGGTHVDLTQVSTVPISTGEAVTIGPKGDTGATGPAGPANLVVSPTNPGLTQPGLWVQTGMGASGTGITFWIEDGT